jgi:adenylate cyclase class IV
MQTYEVEVKSLLGNSDNAEALRQKMLQLDPSATLLAIGRQLNHYFEGGSLAALLEKSRPHLSNAAAARLKELADKATDFSVRVRLIDHGKGDEKVFLIAKATIGADSSQNGVARIEFEEEMPLSLQETDDLVMSSGFRYQAKWSRQREEYLCRGINVTLDKNAGYGWLAEFERIVTDPDLVAEAQRDVRALMQDIGVEELPQERLERMFAHYNTHWQDYYGTEKIFIVE